MDMYRGLTEQMLGFSLAMQQTMAKHVNNTLVKQIEVFQSIQKPIVKQGLTLNTNLQHIMQEQVKVLAAGMQAPLTEQLNRYSSSVQRIMAEQLQIFAVNTPNPTSDQMQEFIDSVQSVVAEQMKFTVEMQKLLTEQMQQFTENLRKSLADLIGE
ncbi:MAG: hypothetical protein H6965_10275 [Chromatiaceae bacterium]|nr:hypothetical protein [Chromatiaceae bacterium]